MRFLIIGAGALGGYFGGRLAAAGEDVTFLVRPRRAAQLKRCGLVIRSPMGDVTVPEPYTATAGTLEGEFDAVLVGCKSYDLDATIEDFYPAVGRHTVVIPVLNGLSHIDRLVQRFGRERVLGGVCLISAVLNAEGEVEHLNGLHSLFVGELDGALSDRVKRLADTFKRAGFTGKASSNILQEMWEKWVFIATAAGITTLMRASIGDVVAADATDVTLQLLAECELIAGASGYVPSEEAAARTRKLLTDPTSTLTASMYKDMERGAATEAEHIIGDLLRRAPNEPDRFSLLRVVEANLKTYEARRKRSAA